MPGVHHIHHRQRVHQNLDKFPHDNKWVNRLDQLLLIVAFVAPATSIPQIVKIFRTQNATGVSALSFGMFAFFNIPWIIYGIVHREKPIIVMYILWLISNSLVLTGTLMYS